MRHTQCYPRCISACSTLALHPTACHAYCLPWHSPTTQSKVEAATWFFRLNPSLSKSVQEKRNNMNCLVYLMISLKGPLSHGISFVWFSLLFYISVLNNWVFWRAHVPACATFFAIWKRNYTISLQLWLPFSDFLSAVITFLHFHVSCD